MNSMTQPAGVVTSLSPCADTTATHLLRLMGRGDRDAFAAFYDLHSTHLYSLAFRILNDAADAEEVLENTFVKIWETAPGFDKTVGSPFSWAVAITRDQAFDRLRSRQRPLPVREAANGTGVQEKAAKATGFRVALDSLPAGQRRYIEMALFEGLTPSEIAEALEKPPGSTKAGIRRSMLHLRDGLENQI